MEDKYNQISLEQYSRDLAKLLSDRYFAATETINGQQLISFSPVKQINLFVIKELLISWNREMASLKSPYFDFEDQDVKDALKQFMNVLSRRILIRRPHFEPLLQKAILDTFTLVLNPVTSFDEKFLQVQEEVTQAKLQEHLKYLDLNKSIFSDFVQGLPPQSPDKASVQQKFRLFTQAHYKELAKPDDLLNLLNPLLPISKTDILEKPAFAAPKETTLNKETTLQPAPEPASGPMYNVPPAKEEPVLAATEVAASGPVGPASFTPPVPAAAPQPEIPKAAEQPIVAPSPEMKPVSTATGPVVPPVTQNPDVKLYEKFKTEKPNLNESLRKTEDAKMAVQDTRKIESLKESISINQRFAFINELFNGENMVYHEAIQKLDSFPDAASARNYLLQDLAAQHNWVKKEEHLNKLLKLIDRKFS
ncbi:hypothetical protein [Adhaeribacter soli]|uniref:Uncharacterized protein n=1 Tax=Adhaeribacter soli TaxID=2607655 RepID=A0A5N1IS82_9BACT|nr:hypothetical protein [Adhaeribacter soli]KAA9331206.1 hypothetical protein F0P94_15065 [Adhaeribacter soli]